MLQRPHFLPDDRPRSVAQTAHCVRIILGLVRCFWGSPSRCFGLLSRPAVRWPRPVRNQGGTRLVPWTRGSDRTAALDEMRGPPSKSRRHRTPASSLLDRRHRRSIHNKGEARTRALRPISTRLQLALGQLSKSCRVWRRWYAYSSFHVVTTSPVTSWRSARLRTRRRAAQQGFW